MNIYEKLSKARIILQSKNIKKSGLNSYSNYTYFELQDFLPEINRIFDELKICSFVSFDLEIATLTIVNCEKLEEKILITSPMKDAQLKGCHEIQNLGAVETYQRRYLYMTALEIVESDILDYTHNKNIEDSENKKTEENDFF